MQKKAWKKTLGAPDSLCSEGCGRGAQAQLTPERQVADLSHKRKSTSAPSTSPFYYLHLTNNEEFSYRNLFYLKTMLSKVYFFVPFLLSSLSLMTRSDHWKGAETKGQLPVSGEGPQNNRAGHGILHRTGHHFVPSQPGCIPQDFSCLGLSYCGMWCNVDHVSFQIEDNLLDWLLSSGNPHWPTFPRPDPHPVHSPPFQPPDSSTFLALGCSLCHHPPSLLPITPVAVPNSPCQGSPAVPGAPGPCLGVLPLQCVHAFRIIWFLIVSMAASQCQSYGLCAKINLCSFLRTLDCTAQASQWSGAAPELGPTQQMTRAGDRCYCLAWPIKTPTCAHSWSSVLQQKQGNLEGHMVKKQCWGLPGSLWGDLEEGWITILGTSPCVNWEVNNYPLFFFNDIKMWASISYVFPAYLNYYRYWYVEVGCCSIKNYIPSA